MIGGTDSSGAPIATAELYDPATDAYTDVADALPTPVSSHTATLLGNGAVLITGGVDSSGAPVAAAQLFDPETQTFTAIASMQTLRVGHTATVLSDGRVLIAGGADASAPVASLEIFDPTTNAFFAIAPGLGGARKDHTATVLGDKTVLIAGGSDGTNALASAEVFNPADGTVTTVGSLATARSNASAAPLIDGSVIIIGGSDSAGADLDTAEIYNPTAQTFSTVPSTLAAARSHHAGVTLPSNWSVLVAGGTSGGTAIDSAELFSPFAGVFQNLGSMSSPRGFFATNPLFSALSGLLLASGGADSSNVALGISEAFSYPTITSDADDYAPNTIATIVGTGWKPGETVDILIQESDGSPDTDLSVTASGSGIWSVEHDVGFNPDVRFMVTASGAESGWSAQRTFTDTPKVQTVSVGAQSPNPVTAGNSASYTVSVTRGTGNDAISATLSITTALPAGAGSSFSTNPILFPASQPSITKTSTLTLTTTCPTTPGATTAFTVRGTRSDAGTTNDFADGAGSLVVTACATGPTKLAFTSAAFTGGTSLVTGQCSTPLTVQTQNASSVATNPTTNKTINLTSDKAGDQFFTSADTTCAGAPISSVSILTTGNSASFRFRPASASTHVVTAADSAALLTLATQNETVNPANTTTAITGDAPDPSVVGQSYTVNWSVTVNSPGSLGAALTGTVTVAGGSGCSAAVAVGTCMVTSTTAGAKLLTATYGGDGNYNASPASAPATAHTVNPADTTTTITNVLSPATVVGEAYAVNWSVSVNAPGSLGAALTGTVTVAGGSGCSAAVAVGTCMVTSTTAGAKLLTATYGGDGNYNASPASSPATAHTVNPADTTTTITSDLPDPTVIGEAYTVTYTVAVTAPGSGTPTGNVTVSDGTDTCIGTVAAGSCSLTSTTTGAPKTLTATYGGDGNFNASPASAGVEHTVNKRVTETTVILSPTSVVVAEPSTVTVRVQDTSTGTKSFPTGTVGLASSKGTDVFTAAASCLLVATVTPGRSECSATVTPAEASLHTITATFTETAIHLGDTGSADLTVTTRATETTVTFDDASLVTGQTATTTVKVEDVEVAGVQSFPSGTVAVSSNDGTDVVTGSPCTLASTATPGVSQCTAVPPTVKPVAVNSGTRTITVSYAVNSVHSADDGTGALTVTKADTSTTTTSDINPSIFGVNVTFTATVAATAPGSGTPGGTVDFLIDSVLVADDVALVSGSASYATNTLTVPGSAHEVKAVYSGSVNYNGSMDLLDGGQTVTQASTSLTAADASGTFGGTANLSATLSSSTSLCISAKSVSFTLDGTSKGPDATNGAGLAALASVSLGGPTIAAGTYPTGVGASFAGDANCNLSSDTAQLIVNQAPVDEIVTVTPSTQQYSDKVTFEATLDPATILDSDPAATHVTFDVDGTVMGTVVLLVDGSILRGTLSDVPLIDTPLVPVSGDFKPAPPPAPHTVTATFTGINPNFDVDPATTPLTITKEDAFAYYTGALYASTSCTTCSTAKVTLAATIKDITAVLPGSDGNGGDIRNATVQFVDRGNSDAVLCSANVGLVNLADPLVGTAVCTWYANLGTANAINPNVGIIVNNYYTRNSSDDDTVITVAKPLANFITGGGYLLLSSSAGQVAGASGKKNNFGFNVKFNKQGTNLQGNINTIVRSDVLPPMSCPQTAGLHVYQVKGNAMTSLSVNTTYGKATFNGKANITDITNSLAPCTVDGNAKLQVTMDDNGEPGAADLIGITVWNKYGGLWFASKWDGTKTVEQLLGGGNLVVH